jgi:hypothetical protein
MVVVVIVVSIVAVAVVIRRWSVKHARKDTH